MREIILGAAIGAGMCLLGVILAAYAFFLFQSLAMALGTVVTSDGLGAAGMPIYFVMMFFLPSLIIGMVVGSLVGGVVAVARRRGFA